MTRPKMDDFACERCNEFTRIPVVSLSNQYNARMCLTCVNAWDDYANDLPLFAEMQELVSRAAMCVAQTTYDGIDRASEITALYVRRQELVAEIRGTIRTWIDAGVPSDG